MSMSRVVAVKLLRCRLISWMLDDGVCQGSPRVVDVSDRTHVLGVSKGPIKDPVYKEWACNQQSQLMEEQTNGWMDK